MIVIDQEALQQIREHGAELFPHECCGFLLGEAAAERKDVRLVVRAENAREQEAQSNRFLITPQVFLAVERTARDRALSVLGFYHSHPNAPARPSAYDLEYAWPWYSYLVVSVGPEGAREVTSWVMEDDRSGFGREEIAVPLLKETTR